SSDVKVGDELTISFGNKTMIVKIDKIVESTKKEETKEMYTVISEMLKSDENK
ncbi:MAG: RNA-binding S4 domain-containing protein, partial [Carnobacterium sp.]